LSKDRLIVESSVHFVDIGVFAYNEADTIGRTLESLFSQDILTSPDFDVRVHVLANGCTDTTAREAHESADAHGLQDHVFVHDLNEPGKSRTWNRFVHQLSREKAGGLVFMDSDIRIPEPGMLSAFADLLLSGSSDIDGVSSRAVKDIVHDPSLKRGLMDDLIGASGGNLNDWRSSICGQLYMLRAETARSFHLPIGLPVEDGFVRAMVQTKVFTQGGPENRIDGRDDLFHVYESERSLGALIRHQTRIIVGSAINVIIYDHISRMTHDERLAELLRSARDPSWLGNLIKCELPRAPYGYLPPRFLFKRIKYWWRSSSRFRLRRMAVMSMGFVFDVAVYVRAQFVMLRGFGAGYW
jgi:glycosyltransferase involved in cell wall biosynthesis